MVGIDVPSPSPSPFLATSAPTARTVPLARIVAFFAISLGIVSALSLPFALGLAPAELVVLVVPVGQLAPLAAALLVKRRGAGERGALALRVPSAGRLALACVLALAAFVLVPLLRVLLGAAAGIAPLEATQPVGPLLLMMAVLCGVQSVLAIGEEAGWRGWLQTQLAPLGFWRSSMAIGLLWAAWHVPIVLALGGAPREQLAYLLPIIAVAPLLSALRAVGWSVWPAVLGHGLLNSVRVGIEQGFSGPTSALPDPQFWALTAISLVLWPLAAAMVLAVGGGAARTDRMSQG